MSVYVPLFVSLLVFLHVCLCTSVCLLWLFFCTVTDFSAGALPIGVKFCTAVRPHLRQVFSHFGGYSPRDGGVMGVKSTCIDVVQDVLMVHGLLVSAERSDQSVAC